MKAQNGHPLHYQLTKKAFEKLIRGYPWIFDDDFKSKVNLGASPGLVALGEHWFFYSPQSKIILRRLGPAERHWPGLADRSSLFLGAEFSRHFGKPLVDWLRALYLTKQKLLGGEQCFRWVFSDNDGIPGLVVDVFEDTLVCHLQSAPVEHFWKELKELLSQAYDEIHQRKPEFLEIRTGKERLREGLQEVELAGSDLLGDGLAERPASLERKTYKWNSLLWKLKPGENQKTGAYFDQKENHLKAVEWAKRLKLKSIWDLCCFEGGFGLHLAKNKFEVLALDSSQTALDTAALNVRLNDISPEFWRSEKGDIFDWLKNAFDLKKRVDGIILDPPSFVKSKKDWAAGMRGLKELNLRALHCLKPGGLLVTCSCSHEVSPAAFREMILAAGHDARREIRILEVSGPSPDHAPLVTFPESEYLQAWFLWVM